MKPCVLFVDDEPSFLEGLHRMLRHQAEEWDMSFATSVDEAMAQLRRRPADAVVCDVRMPCKDGFEMLRALRADDELRNVPVVILTGAGEEGMKRRALEEGATDLLNKPATYEDLLARIRSVLRLKSYQDQLRAHNEELDRKVKERTVELEGSRTDIVLRLAKAAEFRDEETGNHVVRVGFYCRELALEMGLPEDFAEMLFLTSPLHDIGKIGIPDAILLKPGKLTPQEWAAMQAHANIGADILDSDAGTMALLLAWRRTHAHAPAARPQNPVLKMASVIARFHHEKWNGQGYPNGRAGEAIPVEARIAALSDVYDALCSARPYKPAFPEEKAAAILEQEAGRHFDPAVYAAFRALRDRFRTIHAEFSGERPAEWPKTA